MTNEELDLLTEPATVCMLEILDSSDGVELRETLDVVELLPLLLPKSGKSGKSPGPSLPKSGKSTGPSVPPKP